MPSFITNNVQKLTAGSYYSCVIYNNKLLCFGYDHDPHNGFLEINNSIVSYVNNKNLLSGGYNNFCLT